MSFQEPSTGYAMADPSNSAIVAEPTIGTWSPSNPAYLDGTLYLDPALLEYQPQPSWTTPVNDDQSLPALSGNDSTSKVFEVSSLPQQDGSAPNSLSWDMNPTKSSNFPTQQAESKTSATKAAQNSMLCASPSLLAPGRLDNDKSTSNTSTWYDIPNSPPNLESEKRKKQKHAHALIEKRYREVIEQRFEQLDNVLRLQHRHEMEQDMRRRMPKRSKRALILEYACRDIVNLQAEVNRLEEKLETLRQTAFPDTCKYTMHHPRTASRA